jgi:hypothetical protein
MFSNGRNHPKQTIEAFAEYDTGKASTLAPTWRSPAAVTAPGSFFALRQAATAHINLLHPSHMRLNP